MSNASNVEGKLLRVKQQLEQARKRDGELAGAQKEVARDLKRKFGCGSIKDARKLLRQLTRQADSLTAKLEEETDVLNSELG